MRYKHIPSLKKSDVRGRKNSSVYATRLIIFVSLLALFGIFALYNVSLPTAMREFNDKYYFVKEQSKWLIIGLCVLIGVSYIPFKFLKKAGFYLWIGTVFLLVLVLIPNFGISVLGASRWISLGPLQFQPSELMKISIILYLASLISKKGALQVRRFLAIIFISIFPIVLQPDLGTATLILLIGSTVYFISGVKAKSFAGVFALLASITVLLSFTARYRMSRITSYLNPFQDPHGASYHIRQVLIALGSGGFLGVGLGKSRQKYSYIPEMTTDSIIAVIGEEIGLFGLTCILILYLFILHHSIRIVFNQTSQYGTLLTGGLTAALAFQITINLSAMVSLIPLTGVPLPSISYGGTNLLISFIIIGLIVGSTRSHEK